MECCLDSECCDGTESRRDDEAMLGCRNPATADGNCITAHIQLFFSEYNTLSFPKSLFKKYHLITQARSKLGYGYVVLNINVQVMKV